MTYTPPKIVSMLFEEMKANKIRDADIFQATGVSPATLWKWRNGKSRPSERKFSVVVEAVREMKRWYVYELTVKTTGLSYIGHTYNVNVRLVQHLCEAKLENKAGAPCRFHIDVHAAGRDGLEMKVLSVHTSRRESALVEKALIKSRSGEGLYNRYLNPSPLDGDAWARHLAAKAGVDAPRFPSPQAASLAPSDDAAD